MKLYSVKRTDNHSGLVLKASSEAEAIKKARRYPFMKGAVSFSVQPWLKASGRFSVTK